jgi:hypothetical protein
MASRYTSKFSEVLPLDDEEIYRKSNRQDKNELLQYIQRNVIGSEEAIWTPYGWRY